MKKIHIIFLLILFLFVWQKDGKEEKSFYTCTEKEEDCKIHVQNCFDVIEVCFRSKENYKLYIFIKDENFKLNNRFVLCKKPSSSVLMFSDFLSRIKFRPQSARLYIISDPEESNAIMVL